MPNETWHRTTNIEPRAAGMTWAELKKDIFEQCELERCCCNKIKNLIIQ